ncbi:High mobility group B1 isoform 3 [Theobroma cacao]|uniref:High mobility group B1 isoform 3 n=1 Tax=Theobroma cacao TaxID=3641 RepID=A0A061FMB2_THECC|nr:High mobility group B1 isoform 3 [Theobroma cacao]
MKATRSRAAARKDNKETVKPVEDRTVGKRKAALRADKSSKKRTKNVKPAKKDPNKPKRPATAFFVFLEEFRKIYKQEHPKVKAVSAVGKAGGEKWKSLSDAVMHKTSTVAPSGPGYAPITCSTTLELLWHGQANASLVLTTGDLDIWYCIGLDGGF